MPAVLELPHFHNEEAAFAYVEAIMWPKGPVCPHCGAESEKIGRLQGKTTRPGLRKCYACRKPFTVRIGAIFEDSHAPLRYWLQAIHLMCASKKGISTRQLQRMLGCSMKTAWFMGHRIREAMAPADGTPPLGGEGVTVEADETFITKSRITKRRAGETGRETQVMSLVERGGRQRSVFLDHTTVRAHLARHLHPKSRLVTDQAPHYKFQVDKHEAVDHSKGEYVRGDVHINTLEGFFSIFKRGLIGVYQHVSEDHRPRYLAEFDFRQNTREKLGVNDTVRAATALLAGKDKRLTYRTTDSKAAAV
ncbi:MAG TPA: IS1595 family transposase [Dongiaceae bacterium]|nr:IS1595 family transposase [Dongiaceae bacterium]